MNVIYLQIIVVCTAAIMVIVTGIQVLNMYRHTESLGETVWYVKSKEGVTELSEGTFWAKHPKEKAKLFLNVQKDCIFLTVVKGKIRMNSVTYQKNLKEQIILKDYALISVGNQQLQFIRKKVS